MEYYTSEAQERELNEIYMNKVKEKQDKIQGLRLTPRFMSNEYTFISQPERIFIVEDQKVYLGQVDEKNRCPTGYTMGGKSYGVDYMFTEDVQKFVKRHNKYMVIFNVSGRCNGTKKYCGGQGIYPARMVADFEEIILEDEDKYISQTL
jgi:hypothetical protein